MMLILADSRPYKSARSAARGLAPARSDFSALATTWPAAQTVQQPEPITRLFVAIKS